MQLHYTFNSVLDNKHSYYQSILLLMQKNIPQNMPILNLKVNENLNDDQKLWRYMDLSKFISMLDKQAIWLARVDTFKDKHEGQFPDYMKKVLEEAYTKFPETDNSPVRDAADFQDYLCKNTFVNCWHRNTDENMVMWEIYAKNVDAISIQTTVGNLKHSVLKNQVTGHSLILQSVAYQNPNEVSKELPYEQCFFIKRSHYSFEDEVRISLDTYSPANPTKNTAYGRELKVNINGLIEKILVHPDSDNWFFDVVNSIAKKYQLTARVSRGVYGSK